MEETEETLSVSELVVYHIIQEIISEGGNLLYQNYISSKSVQFSAESLSAIIVSTVESYFFRFDTGETMIWADDLEPTPSCIDTWARNAIPVKKIIKMPQTNQSPFTNMQDAKSVVSYTSRRSVAGKLVKGGKGKNLKENSAIEETATPIAILQPKNEQNDEEELLRGKKEREFKKKKEEAERLKKIKEEEDERDKKLQKETEEMKNKSFTYDHRGKILFVNPVKYDNFPNTYTAVRYVSQEPVKEEIKLIIKKQPPRDFGSVKRNRTAPMQEQE